MTKIKKKQLARPEKEPNLLEKVHECLKMGHYRDTRHSKERRIERGIDLPDIIEVLETGYHEKRKDEFREDFQSWNYAIRGKTFEGHELRIAVYFEKNMLMLATAIKL